MVLLPYTPATEVNLPVYSEEERCSNPGGSGGLDYFQVLQIHSPIPNMNSIPLPFLGKLRIFDHRFSPASSVLGITNHITPKIVLC